MKMNQPLITPVSLGDYKLSHRVVLAPLTRMRAMMPGNLPWSLNVEYYRQRTSPGGLLITEGTPVSAYGHGYYATPGIHTEAQREAWKPVTQAVHEKGGRIFLQLWHVGRLSHTDLQPEGKSPVAPSAINAEGKVHTQYGEKITSLPRALERSEIPAIIDDFRRGAEYGMKAGFDGVEIHGANGYLFEQFLSDHANRRTDDYGGSLENRARLLLETVRAVVGVFGKKRVAVRLSPSSTYGGIEHADRWGTYSYVVSKLNEQQLAYLHFVEPRVRGNVDIDVEHDLGSERFRPLITGETRIISAGGYSQESGNAAIVSGKADLIAYGRHFIANPDLPKRFELGAALNPYSRDTFYGGAETGYTDYSALNTKE